MKMVVEETKTMFVEMKGEGFESLLGQRVTLLCANYFYTGKLIGVNADCILLGDKPAIVYETGDWSEKSWKDAQTLPTEKLYVMKSAIESFGVLK